MSGRGELEAAARAHAPNIARVVAALEAVAAGRVPEDPAVVRVLERSGYVTRNPRRHGHDYRDNMEPAPGVWVARCRCGWQSPACTARADEDGEVYDGELWAEAAVDVHAAAENGGVLLWVLTATGERMAAGTRRHGATVRRILEGGAR